MLLRKHFEGGTILNIFQHDLDRIVIFKISKNNEFGDKKDKYLIVELMGKNSNLIIADENLIIIDSLRKNGISEDGRTILAKAHYYFPETNKKNIYELNDEEIQHIYENNVSSYKDIITLFSGFSPIVAKIIFNSKAPITELLDLKHKTIVPCLTTIDNKEEFMCFEYGNIIKQYADISTLLEEYFYKKTIANEVMEKSNNLKTHITHTVKRLNNKIVKLQEELQDAINSEMYQLYGELIINNLYQIKNERVDKITLLNYYTNEYITIDLDSKISIKENANRFFTRYQKSKKAITYINEQIKIANDEIEYLELILSQINNANVNDIEQIKNELIEYHYIKKTSSKQTKNRKEKIEILTYYTSTKTKIFVGKNNIQNEYITHKLANANDMWYHVKDAPGSHVLVQNPTNSEEEIRTAAMLAAYYSTYQSSSSVAINYTLAKNIKKIPGKRNCFVTFTGEKTIYIDPDVDFINKLEKTKI
jgi:predicted ribosome quality control (RQC) complex YloA/Tae2 family protein